MATEGRLDAVIDTSTLVNFLRIRRADLLAQHPRYRFWVTNHVRLEVIDTYPEQLGELEGALESGGLQETVVENLDELATFASLVDGKRLGKGESAAIAAAHHRRLALAIDDRRAQKVAKSVSPGMTLENTESLMTELVRAGVLSVEAADFIKREWELKHRFRLGFDSFAKKLHSGKN